MSHSLRRYLLGKLATVALLGVAAGCGQPPASITNVELPTADTSRMHLATLPPTRQPSATARPTLAPTATPLPTAVPSTLPTADPAGDPVFVGAGDIAYCGSDGSAATARLLDRIDGTVFTLGDNAYEAGSAEQFRECYDPTWGRHKARTRPSPGNHDYATPGAAAYYDYFGTNAGPERRGYYSYELGAWHIVALNSETDASLESDQAQWLAADLAAHPAACTLAYWHRPVFSSGSVHGNDPHMQAIWDILAHAGADVVLTGHDHIYERFAPQTSDGAAEPQGIREFVVGTGGASLYGIGSVKPNSEARGVGSYGVLKLKLHASSYDWEFVPVETGGFSDSGSAACNT
jgi:calcineurin-like phosphoesterase family protein